MSDEDLGFMTAFEAARLIRAKEISPVELTDAVLRRAEIVQNTCNAFITISDEVARAEARRAEESVMAGDDLGPLHGVPFTVKDLVNTAGVRTTFGSHAFADNVPKSDSIGIARLRDAGAVLIGKTTTPEFGHKPMTEAPLFGRTLNPWDLTRTSGGSSGGAGVAAATGIGPLHVGTDGGGSTRIPAAACGVVGMKQTLGRVPHDMSSDSFGCMSFIGPITRTVEDCGLMLDVMAGPHLSDVHSLGRYNSNFAGAARGEGDLKGVKIGWRRYLGNDSMEAETQALFESAVPSLADQGAELVDHVMDFEPTLQHWAPLTFSLWNARFSHLAEELGEKMTETLRFWMKEGNGVTGVEVQRANEARTRLFRLVESWFTDIDLLVTPTLTRAAIAADHDPREPITLDEKTADVPRASWYPYTHPFNLTGHPAITVPCGFTSEGLPVGLQIVGQWLSDEKVLHAAACFERARPWAERRPEV